MTRFCRGLALGLTLLAAGTDGAAAQMFGFFGSHRPARHRAHVLPPAPAIDLPVPPVRPRAIPDTPAPVA
ncbi:hypothetical protein, partial [Beijerinckia sp. L45]|uniref:hypothetical protein n=1 Tax=Beijerinckia sp. L45 TaxID=1641855 RepID=UPI001AED5828